MIPQTAKPRYFIVTSHGWSASHWLASSLNLHPEIVCCHSVLNILATPKLWSEERMRSTTEERAYAETNRDIRSIDTMFDEIHAQGHGRMFGNVHTLRMRNIARIQSQHLVTKLYKIMNLIRHPVSLVASGNGQIRDMLEWDVFVMLESGNTYRTELNFFRDLSRRHQINLCDPDVRSFLAAARHQLHLGEDVASLGGTPIILMERITKDRAYFSEVVSYLSDDIVDVNDTYLDQVFGLGRLNTHRGGFARTAESQYKAWNNWQKVAFNHFLEVSGIREPYESYGYDFSFL